MNNVNKYLVSFALLCLNNNAFSQDFRQDEINRESLDYTVFAGKLLVCGSDSSFLFGSDGLYMTPSKVNGYQSTPAKLVMIEDYKIELLTNFEEPSHRLDYGNHKTTSIVVKFRIDRLTGKYTALRVYSKNFGNWSEGTCELGDGPETIKAYEAVLKKLRIL